MSRCLLTMGKNMTHIMPHVPKSRILCPRSIDELLGMVRLFGSLHCHKAMHGEKAESEWPESC